MPQQRLSNEEHGSVFLTQKPLASPDSAALSTDSTIHTQVLVRATNGATVPSKSKSKVPSSAITKKHSTKDRIKLATVVDTADLEGFYTKYAEVCKKGMEGLRKRDKKKAKAKKKGKKTT